MADVCGEKQRRIKGEKGRIFVASERRKSWIRHQYNTVKQVSRGEALWSLSGARLHVQVLSLVVGRFVTQPVCSWIMLPVLHPDPQAPISCAFNHPMARVDCSKDFLCGGSVGLDPSCRGQGCPLPDFLDLLLFLCLESWSGEIWDPSHMTGTFGQQIVSGWSKSRCLRAWAYV